jgi:hypothetical protein
VILQSVFFYCLIRVELIQAQGALERQPLYLAERFPTTTTTAT